MVTEFYDFERDLLRRAAELLIKWEHPGIDMDWLKERKEWLEEFEKKK